MLELRGLPPTETTRGRLKFLRSNWKREALNRDAGKSQRETSIFQSVLFTGLFEVAISKKEIGAVTR